MDSKSDSKSQSQSKGPRPGVRGPGGPGARGGLGAGCLGAGCLGPGLLGNGLKSADLPERRACWNKLGSPRKPHKAPESCRNCVKQVWGSGGWLRGLERSDNLQ